MGLPYENATTGDAALSEIQKILSGFGCTRFGTMTYSAKNEVLIQFTYRERDVSLAVSAKGYAAAWLKEHPYTSRMQNSRAKHEAKAITKGEIAVYSILRDWIKGQVMAIECGVLSFETAFLGQLMLPGTTHTVMEHLLDSGKIKLLEHDEGGES